MSATPPQTAPYGAWRSPITSALIVAQSISLGEARLDGDQVYWGEGRPQDNGRQTVVRRLTARCTFPTTSRGPKGRIGASIARNVTVRRWR